jgi:single-strand DNA-binding protein
MASYNKITLIGNVGKDPEIRSISADKKVADISIAVNDSYRDANGQQQEKTEWFRVSFWNQKAEVIEKYVRKGQQIYVEGRLRVRTYTDKEGKERYSLEVIAQDFTLLGSRQGEGEMSGAGNSGYGNTSSNAGSNSYSNRQAPREMTPSLPAGDETDDLPF